MRHPAHIATENEGDGLLEPETLAEKQALASQWFRDLRDQICATFEAIEREYQEARGQRSEASGARSAEDALASDLWPLASFQRTPWSREGGGSGEMSLMKGRVFEKVGVNISTVHGEFSEQFRKEIPGAAEHPNFWAAGISLVAHMASPKVPAAHFNTRMIVVGGQSPVTSHQSSGSRPSGDGRLATGDCSRLWFGGGGDLNPMVENDADTRDFHAAFEAACDAADPHFYPAFKEWCDEYFFIPHRGVARGVGGIFYDYLGLNRLGADHTPVTAGQFGRGGLGKEATAHGMEIAANAGLDWLDSFRFTQNVGRAFAEIYPAIIRRHMFEDWTEAERHHQLVKRGRYAEYNLLYDRGTRFGLMTGGNAEAILMSLPPVAIWE